MFICGNRLEFEKGERIAHDIYCIGPVKESDQDSDGNAFEIFYDENSEDDM